MKKLLLINPANQKRKGFIEDASTRFTPLGLGIVAALTPPDWEIEFIDESFELFTYRDADLVGFTGFTSNAPRAYDIAAIYRAKGIHTVMGGIHATMCTAEVAKYMDTVVCNDAEGIWPQVVADFEKGEIKSIYQGGYVDPKLIKQPRREIYKKYPYAYDLVQTSRGCPIGCDFCSVTQMCGQTYRERDVEDVLNELEKTSCKLLIFADDNLVNNSKRAQERAIRLFKGMVDRGIKKHWLSQAALNFADNEQVLYWARKAGCMMILIGIEAESADALKDIRKNLNLKRGVASYHDTFKKIHKHGIAILATMIFGMESDKKEDLYARRNFIEASSIDAYQCTVLTPLPGTVLFDRLKQKDYILSTNYPHDWQDYHCMKALVNTSNMDQSEIQKSMNEIWLSLYNKQAIRLKMFRTFWNTKSFKTAYWAYSSNHNYGRISLEELIHTDPNGVNKQFEWKNKKRSVFLKLSDKVLWLFYQLKWQRLVKSYYKGIN